MLKVLYSLFGNSGSLKNRILYSLMLFTIVPLLIIFGFFYAYYKGNIEKEYIGQINNEMSKCVDAVNRELDRYINSSNYIITNNYLLYNLSKDYSKDISLVADFYSNLDMLFYGVNNSGNNTPFTVYTYNQTLFESKFIKKADRLKDDGFFNTIVTNTDYDVMWNPALEIDESGNEMIIFYRNILLFTQKVGVIKAQVPFEDIKNIIKQANIPQEGFIVYKTNAFKATIKGEGNEAISERDSSFHVVSGTMISGHTLSFVVPKNVLWDNYRMIYLLICFVVLLFILVIFVISSIISRRITKGLSDFITEIKNDDTLLLDSSFIKITDNDEIGIIKLKFRELIERLNKIYKEAMEVKQQKSALEIELLQNRINPHLLYNSLSMLRWRALANKDNETCNMIDTMTSYYRSVLNKGRAIIKIEQELKEVSDYVKINEFARDANYHLTVNVEEKVKNSYIIQLLLQPFVENAIHHGLNSKEGECNIVINGYIDNGDIILEIKDNGYGMSRQTLESLSNMDGEKPGNGYGIRNTIKRIKMYFGDRYGVSIQSELNKGTTVSVRIPMLTQSELESRMKFNEQ